MGKFYQRLLVDSASKTKKYNQIMPILIEVYSDGSGNTFESDGGFGYRIVVDGILLEEGNGYLPKATNNVAEITAAIQGLKQAEVLIAQNQWDPQPKIVLVSDSQLVLNYANGKYHCKAEHLKPLHQQLRKLYTDLDLDTRWVRGHCGDEHNEGCDKLAKAGRESKGKVCDP